MVTSASIGASLNCILNIVDKLEYVQIRSLFIHEIGTLRAYNKDDNVR